MLNSKIFPFERNRYYNGKLLTTMDFICEQRYFNDKRRLLNRLCFDFGIITGLNTFKIDDFTISIESGIAIDQNGREIVIPQLIAKKLSSIMNFEKIEENSFYLCLNYAEKQSQTEVNLLQAQNTEDKRNRIEEGYILDLKKESDVMKQKKVPDLYIYHETLYEDEQIKVSLRFPKLGQKQKHVLFKVEIENKSFESIGSELNLKISVPGMVSDNGNSYIDVRINKIKICAGKTVEFLHSGRILMEDDRNIAVSILSEDFKLLMNDIKKEPRWERIDRLLSLTSSPIFEEIECSVQAMALTDYFRPLDQDFIVLAGIKITRIGLSYRIDEVIKNPFRELACSAVTQRHYEQIREYFLEPKNIEFDNKMIRSEETEFIQNVDFSKYLASGVIDIPIGLDQKVGSVIFSDETMHGLGRGPVNVSVSVELYHGDSSISANNETISGRTDIFYDRRSRNLADVETAVKVMSDRGTFIVGIRLLNWTDRISISLRWSAFKAPDTQKHFLPYETNGASLTIVPDTIVIVPGETTIFTPVLSGMDPSPCLFEVMDTVGGSIDNNGAYVAPLKEGVYEIRATSVSNPNVYATAFVVVKQKKIDK